MTWSSAAKGSGARRSNAMRQMMSRLKLTVNEEKTRMCRVPEETFDFLGYTFGRCYSPKTGQAYIGTRPSKKSIKRMIEAVHVRDRPKHGLARCRGHGDAIEPETWRAGPTIFALVRSHPLIGSSIGTPRRRLRRWLCKKHKQRSGGITRYPDEYLYSNLGSSACRCFPRAFRGRRHDVSVREPDAGDPHVRFDERDVETELWLS